MDRVKQFLKDHMIVWGENTDPVKPKVTAYIGQYTITIYTDRSAYIPVGEHYAEVYTVETVYPSGQKAVSTMFFRHLTQYIERLATGGGGL